MRDNRPMKALGTILLIIAAAAGLAIFIALDAGYLLPRVPSFIRVAGGAFLGVMCFGGGVRLRNWLSAKTNRNPPTSES
jgi:hypothetical protein